MTQEDKIVYVLMKDVGGEHYITGVYTTLADARKAASVPSVGELLPFSITSMADNGHIIEHTYLYEEKQ